MVITYATFKDYITNEESEWGASGISYNGKYVPFVPKHTMNVGGQYIFRIRPGHWLDRIQLNATTPVPGASTGPRRIP